MLIPIYFIFSIVFNYLYDWEIRDTIFQWKYDYFHSNPYITNLTELDKVYMSLEKIPYHKLDEDYLTKTKSSEKEYANLLKDLSYQKIYLSDLNKHIVHSYRIKDFLPREVYYRELLHGKREYIYWNVNKNMLVKLFLLRQKLSFLGYNADGFQIISAYRYPLYNEDVGGARLSRHMRGEALDIRISDIDNNFISEQKDKEIVLEILENSIILNQGGIGKYPGTMTLHFDVRGYKARWDRQ